MTERCDVLVVGGGPGGSSCARALRAGGLDVVVIDRSAFPREKVCAGWITPPVLDALDIDAADYARGRTWQPITAFRTGLIGGRALDNDYGRPVSYGIRRCELDDYLLRRSGARLMLGQSVREIVREGTEWLVNGRLRAPMLVGAGGHACPVARRLRGDEPVPVVRAQEAEVAIAGDGAGSVRCGVPELYFCEDLAGYGWVIRKGDFINVGLGRDDPHDLPGHVERFCAWLRAAGRLPNCPRTFKGHAYRLYDAAMPVPVADGLLLVGDAAGLAHPQTGEGIRPAIESGLLAADVIRQAAGDYRAARLMPYWARLQAMLGRPGGGVAGLVPGFLRRAAGRAILRSGRLTRRVVLDGWFMKGG
ncbi:MAG: NAD(P)/FAD-dependent oxidoreductase [Gammaproteobacteria bacterium]|jgi:flavin-dependent dehydrogenase|nr:NAD(P)/FAD-dependent oxidoreductase [Gammaproteobacteria bacterium]